MYLLKLQIQTALLELLLTAPDTFPSYSTDSGQNLPSSFQYGPIIYILPEHAWNSAGF